MMFAGKVFHEPVDRGSSDGHPRILPEIPGESLIKPSRDGGDFRPLDSRCLGERMLEPGPGLENRTVLSLDQAYQGGPDPFTGISHFLGVGSFLKKISGSNLAKLGSHLKDGNRPKWEKAGIPASPGPNWLREGLSIRFNSHESASLVLGHLWVPPGGSRG